MTSSDIRNPRDYPGDPIIGIDLGTTNSLVAWCDSTGPRCIPDEQGRTLLPSVVRISAVTGEVEAIGHAARVHEVERPLETIYSVKRLMGRGIGDVKDELGYLAYEVTAGEHNTARVKVGSKIISPQEVSAVILRELRRRAEAYFGRPVRRAVVTVPAYFDDAQRQATRDAGRIAGLDVLRIVNEPTAASLAYNLGLKESVRVEGLKSAQAKASDFPQGSRAALGSAAGVSLTPACPSHEKKPGLPLLADSSHQPSNLQPSNPSSSPTLVAVFDLGGGTFDFSILRLQHTESGAVDQVLGTAGDTHLGGDDIDRAIVELIQQEIRRDHGEIQFPPSTRQAFRNLAEAAKIRLSNENSATLEVEIPISGKPVQYRRTITRDQLESLMTPWLDKAMACCERALRLANLKPGEIERVVMVGGSTRAPLVQRRVGEYFGSEPYTALNPDEVVALGAAVQAAILAGVHRDMLLLDVIPLSLGIETMGGAVAKLIVANSTIPAKASESFSTYADGQTSVKIHVLQGERELVKDCRSLGQFELKGIPPMPAGLPKLRVTFLVDANGILNVRAVEERSGKAASIQVVPNHGLTREEVARMENESYAHAREDMTAHRVIDLKNQARLDLRNIERQLQRVAERLDADYLAKVNQRMAAVRSFVEQPAPDAQAFHAALDAMDKATILLAEAAIKKSLSEEQRS